MAARGDDEGAYSGQCAGRGAMRLGGHCAGGPGRAVECGRPMPGDAWAWDESAATCTLISRNSKGADMTAIAKYSPELLDDPVMGPALTDNVRKFLWQFSSLDEGTFAAVRRRWTMSAMSGRRQTSRCCSSTTHSSVAQPIRTPRWQPSLSISHGEGNCSSPTYFVGNRSRQGAAAVCAPVPSEEDR